MKTFFEFAQQVDLFGIIGALIILIFGSAAIYLQTYEYRREKYLNNLKYGQIIRFYDNHGSIHKAKVVLVYWRKTSESKNLMFPLHERIVITTTHDKINESYIIFY